MSLNCVLAITLIVLSASVHAEPPHVHEHEPSDEIHYNTAGDHNPEYDHESFAGADADSFNQLAPEDAKVKLRAMAVKVDVDGNGRVTKTELTAWITKQMKSYILQDVEQQWTTYNTNEDNFLTWEEYKNGTYGYMEGTDPEDESFADLLARDRRRFERADGNSDDVLSKEEFADYLHPEEAEHMKPLVVEETIQDLDKDKDGFLTLEEYIGEIHQEDDGSEPEWVKSEREQFREHRDTNKDGKLDKEEVAKWILPTHEAKHAEEEASHLMSSADTDKDDELTIDEIVDNHDVFVGSQATNYGSLLRDEL